jgi:hypothetical protein
MTDYLISIPAAVHVIIRDHDGSPDDITPEQVEEAMIDDHGDARYVTLKNGTHFDSDDFNILGEA